METVSHNITWALIHSFWIGLIVWLIVGTVCSLTRRAELRSRVRITGLILFTGIVAYLPFTGPAPLPDTYTFISQSETSDTLTMDDNPVLLLKNWISVNSMIINSIWIIGIICCLLRYTIGRRLIVKYRETAVECREEWMTGKLVELKKKLGISRHVRIMISSLVDSPLTMGVLKPVIYFPVGLTTGFSFQEIETLLHHEMMHIKRHDYLINLMLVSVETLFFFNPIVFQMIREIRLEMEYACDEGVIEAHDKSAYLSALIRLQETNVSNQLILGAKNDASEFKKRIEQITNKKDMINRKIRLTGWMPQAAIVLIVLAVISSSFIVKPKEVRNPEEEITFMEAQQKDDTIRVDHIDEIQVYFKKMTPEEAANAVVFVDGKQIRVVKGLNNALKTADKMMEEINRELISDGILNESRQKITLMFQYSDLLNGKEALGDKYEKYKKIFNRYFPVYDSYATTRIFRLK